MKLNELEKAINRIKFHTQPFAEYIARFNHIILLGNGGSNSIASHIAQDYTKILDKQAISFSDPSRLTCYINDYGRDEAYKEFLNDFATKNTLVILISSSGESMNIINSALGCEEVQIKFVVLTGFNMCNTLNSLNSNFAFFVPSYDYGVVECAHLIFLHSILGD